MTLQEFFNPTELKAGFTDPAQIEKLINVMRTEKDSVGKNVNDATRPWFTVSHTILSTEDRDCLDLFIQLDGLRFIHRWLEDVQKLADDMGGVFVEESIVAILRAVEKLHPDRKRSVSSGIWITVKNFIGHKSCKVRDLASTLLDSWMCCEADDNVTKDDEKVFESVDDGIMGSVLHECSTMNVLLSKQSCVAASHSFKGVHDHIIPSKGSNDFCLERIEEDSQVEKTNGHHNSQRNLDPMGPSLEGERPSAQCDISIQSCGSPEPSSPVQKHDNLERVTEVSLKNNEVSSDANQKCEVKSHENGFIETRISFPANPDLDTKYDVLEPDANHNFQNNHNSKDPNCCSSNDVNMIIADPNITMDNCTTGSSDSSDQGGESCSSTFHDSFANDCILGENEDPGMEVNSFKEVASVGGENLSKNSNHLNPSSNAKDYGSALEYGIVDALEVARKVAEEVARDAGQNQDSSCSSSSSEKPSNSINGKEDQSPPMQSPNMEKENAVPDIFEAAKEQQPEVNISERGLCDFDLNQDFCSEPEELAIPKLVADENICAGFDLNSMAEGAENGVTVAVDEPSSGESCVEVSPKGLDLDLNRMCDERPEEDGVLFPIHSSNGHGTPSPASSSSLRPTIDLNGPYLDYNKADDMGMGFSFTGYPGFDGTMGGFGHALSYGYGFNNGLVVPKPPCISFSAMFGGSAMGIPFVPPPPPPSESYFLNQGGPAVPPPTLPLGLTLTGGGGGSSWHQSFDLNLGSGFKSSGNESGCMDVGLGLSIGEKRKQPEGGMWELFPFPNKIQQPPWR